MGQDESYGCIVGNIYQIYKVSMKAEEMEKEGEGECHGFDFTSVKKFLEV